MGLIHYADGIERSEWGSLGHAIPLTHFVLLWELKKPMSRTSIYFGRNILKEALSSRVTILEIFVETRSAYEWLKSLKEMSSFKGKIEEGIPKAIAKEAHQGIAFRSNHEFYIPFDAKKLRDHELIVLCNHIEDIHNLGSIVRCAAAFGSTLVVHESESSASMTSAALKASAGCGFKVSMMRVDELPAMMKTLKSAGFQVAGLEGERGSQDLYEWRPSEKVALVLGSESDGLEPSVKSLCDPLVRISMKSGVESLNVSHAASIAMSWIAQSKRKPKL